MNKKILDRFKDDVWYFSDYDMASDRINKSSHTKSINFRSVLLDRKSWNIVELNNEENIILFKQYIGYCITNTNLSIASMSTISSGLKMFLYFLQDNNLIDITRQHVLDFYEFLNNNKVSGSTFNERVSQVNDFLQYLQQKEIITKNHVYRSIDRTKHVWKRTNKTVSQDVIDEIFKTLDKIPKKFSLMFLVLYSTGMRVSEVCQIKKGKTRKLDDGYFIEFYSSKMRKEVTNPISENLFKLITKYEESIEVNEEYLFNREPNKPMYAGTFTDRFNELIEPFGIKNANGKPYKYRPHDYRHTIATQMSKRNIPSTVIQAILHHESEAMTYSYIDLTSKDRIESFKRFVNKEGLVLPTNTETVRSEWLRENINAQILPNGMCSLPTKLGKCPNINSCLNCDYFYTTIEFIDVHRRQIEKTEELVITAEKNNWIHQIRTNKENLVHLKTIVKALESE